MFFWMITLVVFATICLITQIVKLACHSAYLPRLKDEAEARLDCAARMEREFHAKPKSGDDMFELQREWRRKCWEESDGHALEARHQRMSGGWFRVRQIGWVALWLVAIYLGILGCQGALESNALRSDWRPVVRVTTLELSEFVVNQCSYMCMFELDGHYQSIYVADPRIVRNSASTSAKVDYQVVECKGEWKTGRLGWYYRPGFYQVEILSLSVPPGSLGSS